MRMNSPTRFGSKLLPSERQNTNDGDLLPKHVGQFMCMDDKGFYVNCVHLLMYIADYSHNAQNK